jgi:hypothetical protein
MVLGYLVLKKHSGSWESKCLSDNMDGALSPQIDARQFWYANDQLYMRKAAGYTWRDYKTNTEIAKELNMTPVLDKILKYRRNWLKHINRMPHNRLPRILKFCRSSGRENQGRPLKRLKDV